MRRFSCLFVSFFCTEVRPLNKLGTELRQAGRWRAMGMIPEFQLIHNDVLIMINDVLIKGLVCVCVCVVRNTMKNFYTKLSKMGIRNITSDS